MTRLKIPYNKPYLTGKETKYIRKAIRAGKISGNGQFTALCHDFFKKKYGFQNVLLTTSGTHALEMAAILIDIKPGDEVIMPSYTFVSTANAFILRGAKIVFTDSTEVHPNMDTKGLESLINDKTRAIVPVHYAGMACDMDEIMRVANKHNLFVIEDAAQAIDSYYKGKPLGSFGHMAAFSFHETKNINAGEGGMLVINDPQFTKRAEIIWEKGTNRAEFFRGEVNKYGWVDIGSSYLPSEVTAAFLYAQLNCLEKIQAKRIRSWNLYYSLLKDLEGRYDLKLPVIPKNTTNNGHIFYIITGNNDLRDKLIAMLRENGILAVFHYLSLHDSMYYKDKHDGRVLPWSDYYSECLVRLPLYYELKSRDIKKICGLIREFFIEGKAD
jgi:dTDP-4-amino-4,6-dideoxygalactose transaminase